MKKIIRTLGLTCILGISFVSCTKEVEILEPKLVGRYRVDSAIVSVAVDLNQDGIKNFDLNKEKDYFVHWDFEGNYLHYHEASKTNNFVDDVTHSLFIYDRTNKTIKLFYDGGGVEGLDNVKIGYTSDGKQLLTYDKWDSEVSQFVTYNLVSID